MNHGAVAYEADAFPLATAQAGARLQVLAVRGGHALQRRLRTLGLPLGQTVDVLHRQAQGALVLAVGEARLALGAGISTQVLVRAVSAEAAVAPPLPGPAGQHRRVRGFWRRFRAGVTAVPEPQEG